MGEGAGAGEECWDLEGVVARLSSWFRNHWSV